MLLHDLFERSSQVLSQAAKAHYIFILGRITQLHLTTRESPHCTHKFGVAACCPALQRLFTTVQPDIDTNKAMLRLMAEQLWPLLTQHTTHCTSLQSRRVVARYGFMLWQIEAALKGYRMCSADGCSWSI